MEPSEQDFSLQEQNYEVLSRLTPDKTLKDLTEKKGKLVEVTTLGGRVWRAIRNISGGVDEKVSKIALEALKIKSKELFDPIDIEKFSSENEKIEFMAKIQEKRRPQIDELFDRGTKLMVSTVTTDRGRVVNTGVSKTVEATYRFLSAPHEVITALNQLSKETEVLKDLKIDLEVGSIRSLRIRLSKANSKLLDPLRQAINQVPVDTGVLKKYTKQLSTMIAHNEKIMADNDEAIKNNIESLVNGDFDEALALIRLKKLPQYKKQVSAIFKNSEVLNHKLKNWGVLLKAAMEELAKEGNLTGLKNLLNKDFKNYLHLLNSVNNSRKKQDSSLPDLSQTIDELKDFQRSIEEKINPQT